MMLSSLAQSLRDAGVACELQGVDVEVQDVRRDSRQVRAGDVYAALVGARFDGRDFAATARAQGAAAVLTRSRLALDLPQLLVADERRALGPLAHALHGDPTAALPVVGITGTNGKTTSAWLLHQALEALGQSPALLGTVASKLGGARVPASFTTPEADDLARFARQALDAGASELLMEVSSHGLAQHRVDGTRFRVAAFTNLSQDHLDFHGSMEAYGEAKAQLFVAHAPEVSVVVVDSEFGRALADRVAALGQRVLRVGAHPSADLRATEVVGRGEGLSATLSFEGRTLALRSPLVGAHNLENLLVALGSLVGLGRDPAEAAEALATAPGAPGRLERVPDPGGRLVLVDYAHTPDALRNALAALRPLTPGKLVCVFGCGGDRDRGKRPKMGSAASVADRAVVTSDNPRTEDPDAIIAEILPGVTMSPAADAAADGFVVEADRAAAIALALRAAGEGDTVLIAGKGHEDYQIIGTEKRDFDDRVVAREVLAALAGEGQG